MMKKAYKTFTPRFTKSEDTTDDDFPTPNWATDILFRHMEFQGKIWEPACGSGKMSRRILSKGYKVVSTTLKDRGYGKVDVDFLLQDKLLAPNIVTNPPFKIANKFVHHALLLNADWTCFLVRTAFMEGVRRRKMFEQFPPNLVIAITDRVLFDGSEETGGGFFLSWFVWKKGYRGRTELRLDWKRE